MSWSAVPLPDRRRALASRTQVVGELLAEGFAFRMDENYSYERGPARTGRPDPKTKRPRSLDLSEFPQEQTGALRSAIFYELMTSYSSDYVRAKAGLNIDMSKDSQALEKYYLYIEGIRSSPANRRGLAMTGESSETHDYMLKHLQRHLSPDRFVVPG